MLTDAHGRTLTYLRLALTDRCNLRCRYCMPAEGINFTPRAELLNYEEILRLTDTLADLGVRKIRLTGGEPLVRRDVVRLVEELGRRVPHLAMTTNGILLPPKLDALAAAGLRHYNLSLDTLDPAKFMAITRRDEFAGTWKAFEALLERGLRTKINVVVMRGQNDDELLDFVALTKDRKCDVRFIEAMPFNGGDGNRELYLSATEMIARVRAAHPELERAQTDPHASELRFRVPGYTGGVGFIPAFSRSLCGGCNRLRLTPQGTLISCLYATKGLETRPLLRGGISREDLRALIVEFVRGKYADGRAAEAAERSGVGFTAMTSIGG